MDHQDPDAASRGELPPLYKQNAHRIVPQWISALICTGRRMAAASATESTKVPTAPCSATRSRCANHTPTPKMLSRSSGLDCAATIIACGAWSGNQSAEQLRWTPCSSPCLDRPAHVHVGSTRWDEKLMQDELHIGVQRARQLLAGQGLKIVGHIHARCGIHIGAHLL